MANEFLHLSFWRLRYSHFHAFHEIRSQHRGFQMLPRGICLRGGGYHRVSHLRHHCRHHLIAWGTLFVLCWCCFCRNCSLCFGWWLFIFVTAVISWRTICFLGRSCSRSLKRPSRQLCRVQILALTSMLDVNVEKQLLNGLCDDLFLLYLWYSTTSTLGQNFPPLSFQILWITFLSDCKIGSTTKIERYVHLWRLLYQIFTSWTYPNERNFVEFSRRKSCLKQLTRILTSSRDQCFVSYVVFFSEFAKLGDTFTQFWIMTKTQGNTTTCQFVFKVHILDLPKWKRKLSNFHFIRQMQKFETNTQKIIGFVWQLLSGWQNLHFRCFVLIKLSCWN